MYLLLFLNSARDERCGFTVPKQKNEDICKDSGSRREKDWDITSGCNCTFDIFSSSSFSSSFHNYFYPTQVM